jgi:hypothetical protein
VFGFIAVGMLLVRLVAAPASPWWRIAASAGSACSPRSGRPSGTSASRCWPAVPWAAVLGTAAGLALWIASAPHLETAAEHRIDRLSLPWWLFAAAMLLAVGTATGAAWRPACAAVRIPITLALSARPPRPKLAHRSATVAALLLGTGVGCLRLAKQTGRRRPDRRVPGHRDLAAGTALGGNHGRRGAGVRGARHDRRTDPRRGSG